MRQSRTYNNLLVAKNLHFQKTIEKLIRREKAKEFMEKVDKILKPFDLFVKSRNDMRARAKFASGDWH